MCGQERLAIELKYKTARLTHDAGDERFELREGADDLDRYEFWEDVSWLERLVLDGNVATGIAVMLSNNRRIWSPGTRSTTSDAFRVHEGLRVGPSTLRWAESTSPKTRQEYPDLTIRAGYEVRWLPYSSVTSTSGGEFSYIALTVSPGLLRPEEGVPQHHRLPTG